MLCNLIKYKEFISVVKNKRIFLLDIFKKFIIGDIVSVDYYYFYLKKKKYCIFTGYLVSLKKKNINSNFTLIRFSKNFFIKKIFYLFSPFILNINFIFLKNSKKNKKSKLCNFFL